MNQESKMKVTTVTKALHVLIFTSAMLLSARPATGFTVSPIRHMQVISPLANPLMPSPLSPPRKPTALNVWWFGGTGTEDDDESCELVAVRIEKTSSNSRKIAGDIIVPRPVEDVWAILTDYDNLAIHVPNLVESKRVNPGNGAVIGNSESFQGDGTYQCRLFQRGAQRIVGFEFGASVTMDMIEVLGKKRVFNRLPASVQGVNVVEEKSIHFKCVESQFFSEFDGEWKVSWCTDPDDPSKLASKVEYVVDVRPRGPVPVQALEWRIREDVPTNLRAVKAAAMDLGKEGVFALRESQRNGRNGAPFRVAATRENVQLSKSSSSSGAARIASAASSARRNVGNLMNRAATVSQNTAPRRLTKVRVNWYEDETMATYLDTEVPNN